MNDFTTPHRPLYFGHVTQHPIDPAWTWEIIRVEQRDGRRFGTTVALPASDYPTRTDATEALYDACDAASLTLNRVHIDSPRRARFERAGALAA